jgi:hypothetical protein
MSRSNHSVEAPREYASWASPSTCLQLMDGDAQSEDRDKNKPDDPGFVVPEDPGAMAAPHGT